MGQFISNINMFCLSIFNLLLDNGPGRATVIEPELGESGSSGFSVFIGEIISAIGNALMNVAEFILRCLAKIAYFIAKIAMNLMDLMNVIIKELSGQATAYKISQNASLEESDILFKFLFNDVTMRILRDVFIFALLLLIIFTIIAIIKQEWENHLNGKQNSVKKIFKKVLMSIFTMILVPFIVIVGIVFSNVILSSAMNALTGGSSSYSLGAQMFSASSYEANRYRVYALEGKKIPIVMDYDGGFENTITTTPPELTEESSSKQEQQLNQLISSGNFSTGQSAYNMFKDEAFFSFESILDSSTYYSIYDGQYLKTKQIEYYVMADFLDFAMTSGGVFYIVNIEDVYEHTMNYILENEGMPDIEDDAEEYAIIDRILTGINACNEAGEGYLDNSGDYLNILSKAEDYIDGDARDNIAYYSFYTYYNKTRAETIKTDSIDENGVMEYRSIAGSTDEVTGAKYVFCMKVMVGDSGDYLIVPLSLGDQVNNVNFSSYFLAPAELSEDGETPLRNESMFLARGVFTGYGYPTAIRQEGNNIVFYRQDPISPSAINYSEIFNYESTDQSSGDANFVVDSVDFLTGVDISTLVPDIQVNLNFLRIFSKDEVSASVLDGGKFSVNYSFVGALSMPNLYDELKINYVVLLFAVSSLFLGLYYIIFGLVRRLFEITLLWVTMPGWISKFPIEKSDNITDGTAFKDWKDKMIERILALYSIYLTIALIFLLIPIVFKMNFINTFSIPETNIFGVFNADTANLVIKTAFVLVLFNFLNISKPGENGSGPRMIEGILIWTRANGGYLSDVGQETSDEIKKIWKMGKVFTPKGMLETVKNKAVEVGHGIGNAIPGSSVAHKLMDYGVSQARFIQKNDAMLSGAQSNLKSQTNEADIEKATKELNAATGDHEYLEGYRRAQKDYRRDTGKGLKEDFRNRGGQGKRLSKIAKEGGGTKVKYDGKNRAERSINREIRRKRGV